VLSRHSSHRPITNSFPLDQSPPFPGVKYSVKAVRQGPQSLRLHLGSTHVDVVVRKLNDGGLLVQVRALGGRVGSSWWWCHGGRQASVFGAL